MPFSSVVARRTAPVPSLVAVTVAFWMTAPGWSVIVPVIRPPMDWACAMDAANAQQTKARLQFFKASITPRSIKGVSVFSSLFLP